MSTQSGLARIRVIKFYERPDKPVIAHLVRIHNKEMLINYPLDKPFGKREARWVRIEDVFVQWIADFNNTPIAKD